jgi:phytoene dehydrogenase-like protein
MQKKKKIIIIGAGLAGMSAGCYLQMNGFDTEIFEMHSASGGLCASWKRNDYMIDGCIHFMAGTSPGDSTYQFWNDLIDMQSIRFIYSDTHAVAENEKQERIYFYSDVDQLESELLTKAPEDKIHIHEFIRIIRKFIHMNAPVFKPIENMTLTDKLGVAYRMMPYLRSLLRYMKITNKEFAARFRNMDLKRVWEMAFVGDSPLFYSIMPMVWRHKKETGYPQGGAGYIAGLIEKKYLELGGTIRFNANVTRILTDDDTVNGIELKTGEQHTADIIVSAADGRTTIFDMLQGNFKDKKVTDRYENNVFQTIDKTLYVSLGINRDFKDQPAKLYFPLSTPIYIDPLTTLDFLEYTHYCEDPTAAPKGKTLLTLMPDAKDWEYWNNLRKNDRQKYIDEKERIARLIIDALDKRFGNIKENIEMIDVVTPATYIRYTNNWTGGQISWKGTQKTFGKPTAWQIKGLKGFYMTGQWAGVAGGLNNVVMMGNHLTQIICKKEGVKFRNKIKV